MQKHIDIKRKVGIHEVNFQNKSNDAGSTDFFIRKVSVPVLKLSQLFHNSGTKNFFGLS